jgi:hypothetical protein
VIESIDRPGAGRRESDDFLLVQAATGYGRFCIETGRLSEVEPWPRRAGARSEARGWELAGARTQLERGTAAWGSGDVWQTQTLVLEGYPAMAEGNRAHDVSRSWLYLGLIAMSLDKLDAADERFGQAERHWCEVDKPLHIHRDRRLRIGLLRVALVGAHRLADLFESFGGRALALLVLLFDRAPLGCLGRKFGGTDRGAVSGLDLLPHRLEGRHALRRVPGVGGFGRRR